MKKLLAIFGTLVLLGAGCAAGTNPATEYNDWRIGFNLPEGWAMVESYTEGESAVGTNVKPSNPEIFLQSSSLHHVYRYDSLTESQLAKVGEVEAGDRMRITVQEIDERRLIPSEAQEVGEDMYRNIRCEDESCTGANTLPVEYYKEFPSGARYLFLIQQIGELYDEPVARSIIESATEL